VTVDPMPGPGGATLRERIGAIFDYLRASWLRLCGARFARRVRIGKGFDAMRARGLEFGSRTVVEAGVAVKLASASASMTTGEHVFVGRGCIFDLTGRLEIGDGALLAPGCFVTDHNHGIAAGSPIWRQPCLHEPVRIGAGAWLGARVVVLPGVTIGDGAVVAAGAVVTRDVAPNAIVGGVPARLLRMRSDERS
jgi:acetyltransferase-like isoleucine patch superfamily enzyme